MGFLCLVVFMEHFCEGYVVVDFVHIHITVASLDEVAVSFH
jgi:hypothetical protein